MIAELSAAMTAIKETANLVKIISNAKTDVEVKAATIELQGRLITLQTECFSLGDVIRLRDEETVHLKAKIAEFESFKSESEGYELHKTEAGSVVYSKQLVVNETEITVNACPGCFHQKKISILQPSVDKVVKSGYWVHYCPSCKSEFKMNQIPERERKPTPSPINSHFGR